MQTDLQDLVGHAFNSIFRAVPLLAEVLPPTSFCVAKKMRQFSGRIDSSISIVLAGYHWVQTHGAERTLSRG